MCILFTFYQNDSNHADDMSTAIADLDSDDESKNKIEDSSSLELHKGMVMEEIIKEILNEPVQDLGLPDDTYKESLSVPLSPSQSSLLKGKDLTETVIAKDGDDLSCDESVESLDRLKVKGQQAGQGPSSVGSHEDEDSTDSKAQRDATEGDSEFERIDMLGYVLDWERVLQNSKATQSSSNETRDMGVQYNEVVVKKILADKGVQATEGDFEAPIEYYLETLFKGFVVRSRRFVPQKNIDVMGADRFNKTKLSKSRNTVRERFDFDCIYDETSIV